MDGNKQKSLELRKQGLSQNDIQRELGLSRGIISKWKKSDPAFKQEWDGIKINTDAIKQPDKREKPSGKPSVESETDDKVDFTEEEIRQLRNLLQVKDKLIDLAIKRNSEQVIFDRSHRKKATFNMDLDILDELDLYEKRTNISKSDTVNMALIEYLGISKK